MNRFGLLLAEELEHQGIDLEDLPELLLDAGADDYDAHPGVLAATLSATPEDTFAIGWCPATWQALSAVLDHPPKEQMLPLLKAFYFVDADGESAA